VSCLVLCSDCHKHEILYVFCGPPGCKVGPKKIPVVPLPDRPIIFCRAYYFFNAIDRATLFSPGGCGLLIQRAKMASVVTLIIEPNCLNSSIGNTHL
jgi:hypothetical protein